MSNLPASADLQRLEADEDAFDEQARLAAENLARRQADLELHTRLALDSFQGSEWDTFAVELARYGHAVLMAWMATGDIFRQCVERNCPVGPPPQDWTRGDWEGLANETVAKALINFRRHALLAGGWSFDGGATLKTYFVGAGIYAFPNIFRTWQTEQAHWEKLTRAAPVAGDIPADSSNTADPATVAANRLDAWRAFNNIEDTVIRKMALLRSLGYSSKEIAELLGCSPTAVRMRLKRLRARVNDSDGRRPR
jgi:DNA-directed RNA polymerase specialized sigma24 family protein